jgi:hypothetical protein
VPTRETARRAIFEFIEVFYNLSRMHSSLGYLTPVDASRIRRDPHEVSRGGLANLSGESGQAQGASRGYRTVQAGWLAGCRRPYVRGRISDYTCDQGQEHMARRGIECRDRPARSA